MAELVAAADAGEKKHLCVTPPTDDECVAICTEIGKHLLNLAEAGEREFCFKFVERKNDINNFVARAELPTWNQYINGKGFPENFSPISKYCVDKYNESVSDAMLIICDCWVKMMGEDIDPHSWMEWSFRWYKRNKY
jgi:hypothetical protein